MTTLTYSSDRHSELNTARRYWQMARTMRRYANRGFCSKSAATRHWNKARARLKRAMTGAKPVERYEPDVETTVLGIPCGVVITWYVPAQRGNWGHPDDRLPDEPAEVEWLLVDLGGYRAMWLEEKMTGNDSARIERMVLEVMG